jgi:TRAP-type C4-dicarboxylate transport system substrate-binding protein
MNIRFFSCAALLGLCCALTAPNAGADPVKIKLGTLAPKGSSYAKHLQAMGEQWKKVPGGGAQLVIYPDGQMGSEGEMVQRMRMGQLQAAMVTVTGLSEIEPATGGLQNLPMTFRTLDEVDYIGEKLQPILAKRLEAKGFIVLFWSDTGFVKFFSKTPIITPDDLRKSKLFVSGGRASEVDIYRSMRCQPIPLEVADILPSLQSGLINAVPMPPTIALAAQFDVAAPNMLDMNWAPLVGACIITKKAWANLSPETQAVFLSSGKEAGKKIRTDGRRESQQSIDAMERRGLKVNHLTKEAEADWERTIQEVNPKIRGPIVPEDIFDEVMTQLKAYRALRQGTAK